MKKIGIFYGSSSGTTEGIANQIANRLGIAPGDVHNVGESDAKQSEEYEVLVLGSSTWGAGDLQDDWFDFLDKLAACKLSGKKVALFGCGDSLAFSSTFCDALGTIYEKLQGRGCTFIGAVPTSDYSYDASTAEVGGELVGMLIDENNESDKTQERIENWTETLKKEI